MSNNPFLKSKKSDNRFQCLQDDDFNASGFKDKPNSSKPHVQYDSASNSFTQNRTRYRDRDYKIENPQIVPPPPVEINIAELFPHLINIDSSTSEGKKIISFKNILTNNNTQEQDNNTEEQEQETKIKKGWIEITKSNNKIVYNYGPSTLSFKKITTNEEQELELESELEQELEQESESESESESDLESDLDLNHIMNNVIKDMTKSWTKYEIEYDEIHGEGAYDTRFRIPPVYGPEYDTESDNEYSSEEDDSYDDM
jgi:hypothetical protein